MPYSAMKDINPALKGIKPKITLSQANVIAKWADKIKAAGTAESPWAVAISQFKKSYSVKGGKWMKKKVKEASRGYFTSGTATVEISALDVDGQKVPVSELVAAYQRTDGMLQPGGLSVGDGGDAPAKDFTEAVAGSLEDYAMSVKDAFRVAFKPTTVSSGAEVGYDFWPRDVFKDDPRLDTVVVIRAEDSQLYAVEYKDTDEGFSFATRENWQRVVLTYIPVEEAASELAAVTATGPGGGESQLSESASGRVVGLVEADSAAAAVTEPRAPLLMNIALIEPGWGNERDNNYYTREVLARDAHVFEGVKMYATDHRSGEKSVRTEVSVVKKIEGFTDSGAPLAQVAVHDPDFAESARNREKLGTLETLECSILALGRTKKGEVSGREGNIVEAIRSATSVDWVTKAGAGGRAVALAENITKDGGVNMLDKKEVGRLLSESGLPQEVQEKLVGAGEYEDEKAVQEAILAESGAGGGDGGGGGGGSSTGETESKPTITYLVEAEITEALKSSGLPAQAQARLAEGQYLDGEALKTIVESERAYIKELTGSGRPFAQGGGAPVGEQPMSEAEYDKAYDDIARRHGLYVPEGKE